MKSRVRFIQPKVTQRKLAGNIVGYCYHQGGRIEIDPRQTDKEYFFTHIHELIHLALPDLSERQTIRLEIILGNSLWKTILKQKKQHSKLNKLKPK